MPDASTSETMSLGLLKVVERAKTEPEGRFHSLAHLIDVPALMRAYHRTRPEAAAGGAGGGRGDGLYAAHSAGGARAPTGAPATPRGAQPPVAGYRDVMDTAGHRRLAD